MTLKYIYKSRISNMDNPSIQTPLHIFFDLDGTLIDSSPDLANSINAILKKHKLPIHSLAAVKSFIGNGSLNLMKRSLGPEREELAPALHQEFLAHYQENCVKETHFYPGVFELFQRPFSASLITNKPEAPTLKILNHFGLAQRFDFIFCGDTALERKPSPHSLQVVLQKCQIQASSALMVGDDLPDIGAAKAAGVPVVALLGGFGNPKELLDAQADYYATDFAHFSRLLVL